MKQWETAVKSLIEKVSMGRASKRSSSPSSHQRNGTHGREHSTQLASDFSVASNISPTSGGTTGVSFDGRQGGTTPGLDHLLGHDQPRTHTENANGSSWPQFSTGYVFEPGSRSMLLPGDNDLRNASSSLGDDPHIGSSSSSTLDTTGPLINSDNPQHSLYRHPTLQRNDSLRSSTSTLDMIGPPIGSENPRLLAYPSWTDLQSNGSLYNASFMTSPSCDSSFIEVLNDVTEVYPPEHDHFF